MTDNEKLLQAVQFCSLELEQDFEVMGGHVSLVTLQAYPSKAIAIVKTRAYARVIQKYYDGAFSIDFEWTTEGTVCYDVLFVSSKPAPLVTRFHYKRPLELN